jgi:hypothetical protein
MHIKTPECPEVNQIAKWRIKYYKSAGQQFEAISHTIFNGFVSPRNYQRP